MPIRTAIWRVSNQPEPLAESSLANEHLLETMIVAAPRLISEDLLLIGRQEDTGFGGRIDLLAIAPDGGLVLIELKRDRTPREVVAQALEYASWVERLRAEDLEAIYGRFAPGHRLSQSFHERFGQELDEETLNQSHQIVIVASSLDGSTERIVTYLSDHDVHINVMCFQVFTDGPGQLLSRTWLRDPLLIQGTTLDGSREPWNGEFYCSFGHGENRSWDEAVRYGFICGGGGAWYSRTLQLLDLGDRVWVNVPGRGFVGVGRATGLARPVATFTVSTAAGEVPFLEVAQARYHREFLDDLERCEYFVPMKWLQTVSIEGAVREVGLFGNQNTICRPTTPSWRHTVERLKEKLPNYDG